MRKGIQVRLKFDGYSRPHVYRQTSHEEREEWYQALRENIKAGRDVGYDCAGETKLAPRCTTVVAEPDDTFTVVRGRCAPSLGYSTYKKSALIRNNRTGEEGYAKRIHLEVV